MTNTLYLHVVIYSIKYAQIHRSSFHTTINNFPTCQRTLDRVWLYWTVSSRGKINGKVARVMSAPSSNLSTKYISVTPVTRNRCRKLPNNWVVWRNRCARKGFNPSYVLNVNWLIWSDCLNDGLFQFFSQLSFQITFRMPIFYNIGCHYWTRNITWHGITRFKTNVERGRGDVTCVFKWLPFPL